MARAHRRTSRRRALTILSLLLTGMPALAQDPAASPEPPKIDVTGFVDVYYGYNFNKVDPALRTFDVQHNTFSLSLAEMAFAKAVTTDSRVGFRVDLDFGKTADLTAVFEPEENGKEIYKHIQQAYVSVLAGTSCSWTSASSSPPSAPRSSSRRTTGTTRARSSSATRSPSTTWACARTLPVSDKVTLAGYLVNGWNNGSEINGDKTFGFGATVKPSAKVTWIGNIMAGEEVADGDTRAPLRHHPHRGPHAQVQPDGATSTTARRAT